MEMTLELSYRLLHTLASYHTNYTAQSNLRTRHIAGGSYSWTVMATLPLSCRGPTTKGTETWFQALLVIRAEHEWYHSTCKEWFPVSVL